MREAGTNLFAITVESRWTTPDGWRTGCGVPTFYLDGDVQGLASVDEAASFAMCMLRTLAPEKHFSLTAMALDAERAIIALDSEHAK